MGRSSRTMVVALALISLPVMLAEDPLTAVAVGTGRCLDEIALLREVTLRSPIS